MPRSRTTLTASAVTQPLARWKIEVEVQGVRVVVPCGDGSVSVDWLIKQAQSRYQGTRQGQEHLKVSGQFRRIQEVLSSTGAVLSPCDAVNEVASPDETLRAVIEDCQEGTNCGATKPANTSSLEKRFSQCASAADAFAAGCSSEAYGHNARVFDLAFSPVDSSLLASASDDSTAKIWRREDGGQYCQAASFHGHSDSVMRVNWDASGTVLASASADTTVRLWRPDALLDAVSDSRAGAKAGYGVEPVGVLEGHPEEVYAAEFLEAAAEGSMLTASAWTPFLWDMATEQQLSQGDNIAAPGNATNGAASMPERWQAGHIFCARQQPSGGPLVAAACSDGVLRFWAVQSRGLTTVSAGQLHKRAMGSSCAWHSNGFAVASLGTDGTVAIMDIRMGRACWALQAGRPLFSCTYLPGSCSMLAVCGAGSEVIFLDTANGALSSPLPGSLGPEALPTEFGMEDLEWGYLEEPNSMQQETPSLSYPAASLIAQTPKMGSRNLLCLAASQDGRALVASGDAIMHGGETRLAGRNGAGHGNTSQGDLPSHKQSKRSSIHIWSTTLDALQRNADI